jgi:hypothetical protein
MWGLEKESNKNLSGKRAKLGGNFRNCSGVRGGDEEMGELALSFSET